MIISQYAFGSTEHYIVFVTYCTFFLSETILEIKKCVVKGKYVTKGVSNVY